jgi:DNA-binding NarL/FixJ family response regulator
MRGTGTVSAARGTGEVSVVLADALPVVRIGLRALLTSAQVVVAAEVDTGPEAVQRAVEFHPTVLVLDTETPGVRMPGTVAELASLAPEVAVLIFSTLDDDLAVHSAVAAGARGYIPKSTTPDGIVRAVRNLAAGEAVFGAGIAGRLGGLFTADPAAVRPFPDLTARERQVLDLVARGLRNGAIAHRLHLSPKTISNYISAISAKLGVAGRMETADMAKRAGLGRA